MNVLVVEDDALLRSLWMEVFETAGHTVRGASGSRHARSVLLAENFDVVVLDLCLGDDTGLSVATMATYVNPDCKVVMITGSSLFARGELFELSPCVTTVLRKPVPVDELLAVTEHRLSA